MMSKTPWRMEDYFVVDANGDIVAELIDIHDGPIIAAAPDLLAACERLLRGPTAAARAAARQVIKKARGE